MAYIFNTVAFRLFACAAICLSAHPLAQASPMGVGVEVIAQQSVQKSAPANSEKKADTKQQRSADKKRSAARLRKFQPSEAIQADTVLSFPSDI